MQSWQWLAFDDRFDRTAPHSRKKLGVRVGLGLAVGTIFAQFLPLTQVTGWFALMLAAETLLSFSTTTSWRRADRVFARSVRLAASGVNAAGWTLGGVMLVSLDSSTTSVIGVGLLAAIAVYAIGSCFRTPVHMLACGVPPSIGLLSVPWLLDVSGPDRIAMQAALVIVVGFGAGTAVNAVVTHQRLLMSAATIKVQKRKAEAASDAKTTFLANMSHEIRTPLNGVVAMAQMLARRPLDAEVHDMVMTIQQSGETLERILSDILDASRIDAGKLAIEQIAFHLGDTVRSAAALYQTQASEKNTKLDLHIAPEADGRFLGDPVRIRQIVSNFVSNAVKFTRDGQITVIVEPTEAGVRLSVRDTGIGFDAARFSSVFSRFEQADGTITRRYGGTGLGLAICADLTELMGGEIGCDSTPGQGSEFWVTIPLSPAESEQAILSPAESTPEALSLRVLVADDHPVNRKVVEAVLAGTGCDLVHVEDGAAAVAEVQRNQFDLILMDMQMPIMDGLAATREIRAWEAAYGRGRTPLLMLTANALPEHISAGAAAGADGHLSKPLRIEVLLEAVALAAQPQTQVAVAA